MELQELREKLDKIDEEIVLVLAKRMALIPSIAEQKKKKGIVVYDPQREKEVIESKRKIAENYKLNPSFIENIFREVMKESRSLQDKILEK